MKWTPPPGYWERRRLPEPVPEFRFCERKWRFDFAFVDKKVAVEIDGGIWNRGRHVRGTGYILDMEKINEAQRLGWKIFRFTPQQMHEYKTAEFLKDILK